MENLNEYVSLEVTEIEKKLNLKSLIVEDLDYDNEIHRRAFWQFIKKTKVSNIPKLKSENEKKFLFYAIKKSDGEYFKYLSKEQYCSEYADYYLDYILKNINKESFKGKKEVSQEGLSVQRSFDEKEILVIEYKTHEQEEIQYFDKGLNIPASIISSLIVTIKIKDSLKFLSNMDVSILYVDSFDIQQQLIFALKTALRDTILSVLEKNGMDFYKSGKDFLHIQNELNTNLKTFFDKDCLEITKLNVLGINLSGNIIEQLEQIYFINSKNKQKHDSEIQYQKDSLELFSKKVEILSKNPVAVGMLTEAEKDKALDRYLLRTGHDIDDYGFEKSSLNNRHLTVLGEKNKIEKDAISTIDVPGNPLITYGIIATIILGLSLLGFISSSKLGLILLGIALLINGLLLLGFNGSIKIYKLSLKKKEDNNRFIDEIYENEMKNEGE